MKGGETLALNERIMLSLVSTGVSLCNPCKSCCWNSFDFRVTVLQSGKYVGFVQILGYIMNTEKHAVFFLKSLGSMVSCAK